MKINNIDKLNLKLSKINNHLSAKEIDEDGLSLSPSDGFLQVKDRHKGEVEVFFDDSRVLTMHGVEDTPVIDLDVTIFDKQNGKLLIDILTICNEYLPESGD